MNQFESWQGILLSYASVFASLIWLLLLLLCIILWYINGLWIFWNWCRKLLEIFCGPVLFTTLRALELLGSLVVLLGLLDFCLWRILKLFNWALLSKLALKTLIDLYFVFTFLRARSKGKFDDWFHLSSSIWSFIRGSLSDIYCYYVWIIGRNTNVNFLYDNLIGTPIADSISLENYV